MRQTIIASLFYFVTIIITARPPKGGGRSSLSNQECFLLRSNDTIALTKGFSTYLEIGNINVGEDFNMSMDVLPSPLSHNGILLSVGSEPNFGYYEWKTKAVNTQFLVVEFIFSALALTVKALNTEHLQQIEVYKTYPVPYKIDDARWHSVKVTRNRRYWRVQLDNLNVTREISVKTNVLLQQKPAFIGGRPRYIDHQFQGVIRNVKVNGRTVHVKSKSNELVDVMGCNSNEASLFIGWIKGTKAHIS